MKKMLLAAAGAIAIAAPAAAAPVFFAGTGNYYEFIATDATWGDARAAALASNYFGRQGYLVNITTAEENAFLATLTGGSALAWTGGNDIGSEGNFYWADGPEAGVFYWMGGVGGSGIGYTNWNGGEPNDFSPGEDGMHINWDRPGGWNDYFVTSTHGYIVEYAGLVPEPSAWALLILGFGAVGGALRRSRKVRVTLTYA
mgnify:CR=1 FL=1